MTSDEEEHDRWASERLHQALEAETARRSRVVDRAHGALLVYAAIGGTMLATVQFRELSLLSKIASANFGLMGLLVGLYWAKIMAVRAVPAVDPVVFSTEPRQDADAPTGARRVRLHLERVVTEAQAEGATLADHRQRLQYVVLVALVFGAIPLTDRFLTARAGDRVTNTYDYCRRETNERR